jgi:iron-sulfur cluster insertion protein
MRFTQKAKEKIVEIAAAEKIVDPIVRVKVLGGGCAGFQYDMTFLDSREMYDPNSDEVFEMGKFTVVVDSISYQYVSEAEVDWLSEGILAEGFKFNNPAVKSSCGCGNSVGF